MSKDKTPNVMEYLRCVIRLNNGESTADDCAFIEDFETHHPELKMYRPKFSDMERTGE